MTATSNGSQSRLSDEDLAAWIVGESGYSAGTSGEHRTRVDRARVASRAVTECLAGILPEAVQWLSPGILPLAKVVLFEGDPGVNKSTVALDVAARVTRGEPVFTGPRQAPRNVVLVTFEDGLADTVRPRFDALGGDPARVFVFRGVTIGNDGDERAPTFPGDVAHLQNIILDRDAALVIIDPLGAALSETTDTHNDASVRRVIGALARLAEETGACVLGIRHLIKGTAANALRAGGGSIAFIAAARVAMVVSLHPDDGEKPQHERRRVLACVKNNLAPFPPSTMFVLEMLAGHAHPKITWLGESPLSADDLNAANAATAPEERAAANERAEWLYEILLPGPLESRDVYALGRREGYSDRSVRRTAQAMGVKVSRVGTGRGHRSMWQLPTPATADTPARLEHESGVAGVSEQDAVWRDASTHNNAKET